MIITSPKCFHHSQILYSPSCCKPV